MHHQSKKHNAQKEIGKAFLLNVVFAAIELIGGSYANSYAVISDAIHDLGDSLALAISWAMERKSARGRSETYSYGYGRWSIVASVISSAVVMAGSVAVLFGAIPRVFNPEDTDYSSVAVLAVMGVVVNGYAVYMTRSGRTANERAVSLHLLEDVLGWVGILVMAVVNLFHKVPILDPIIAIGISAYVIKNASGNLIYAMRVLLQAFPEDVGWREVASAIMSIDGVEDVHDIHLWTLDGNRHVLTLHAVVSKKKDIEKIKEKIKKIANAFGIEHTTVEMDFEKKCEYGMC